MSETPQQGHDDGSHGRLQRVQDKAKGLIGDLRRSELEQDSATDGGAPGEERPARPAWVVPTAIAVGVIVLMLIAGVSPTGVIVSGGQTGAIYALVALGIALVYRATRVLNFAQGELGSVAAFLLIVLLAGNRTGDLAEPPEALPFIGWTLVALLAGGVLAVAINVLIVQQLARANPVTSLVATAGAALVAIGAQTLIFGANAFRFPRFIDGAPCLGGQGVDGCESPLRLAGSIISWHTIIVFVVLAAAGGALALLFRTPVGVALLASAQEPFAAELYGVSVRAMNTLAWAAAGVLGAVGGILAAGTFESVQPGFMTSTFLIPAFAAALLGGITSMVGAVVGGLLLGMTVTLANDLVLAYDLSSTLPGPPDIATFLVLLLVLFLRPRGLLGKEA